MTTNESLDETGSESVQKDHQPEREEPSSDTPPPWRPLGHPYLLTLAAKVKGQGPKKHSISIPIGRFNILVSPMDQTLALQAAEGHASENPSHLMIRDAMGMRLMIAVAQRKLDKPENLNDPDIQARLEEGLGLAYRLAHTMTVEVHRLWDEGSKDAADEIQISKRHLIAAIEGIENSGQEDSPEPEKKTEDQRFLYQWDSSGSASGESRRPVTTAKTRVAVPQAPKGTGRHRLIFSVLMVVLGIILSNLWLNRTRQLPDFSTEDFPKVPGIEQVINRSPTILIIVSESQWSSTDRFEKEEAVTSVVDTIKPAGYKAAEFRSRATPSLAAWNGGNKITIVK
ncbi:MAG: hypothetical protein DRJ65_10725 [Acidobacteria bacterium]|nr:MAG: hypothetical protein DRJ65_10725 [Acidobacteriota bacterium]